MYRIQNIDKKCPNVWSHWLYCCYSSSWRNEVFYFLFFFYFYFYRKSHILLFWN